MHCMDFSLLIKDSLHHWVIEPPAKKSNHIQCSSAFDANKTLIPMKFSSVFVCVFVCVCVCVCVCGTWPVFSGRITTSYNRTGLLL